MKCYFEVGSGQKSKRGEGVLLYPPHKEVIVGVLETRTSSPEGWTSPDRIQTIIDRLTRTSPDRGQTSSAKVEPDFWLSRNSLTRA
jgi:hypothetical protein